MGDTQALNVLSQRIISMVQKLVLVVRSSPGDESSALYTEAPPLDDHGPGRAAGQPRQVGPAHLVRQRHRAPPDNRPPDNRAARGATDNRAARGLCGAADAGAIRAPRDGEVRRASASHRALLSRACSAARVSTALAL